MKPRNPIRCFHECGDILRFREVCCPRAKKSVTDCRGLTHQNTRASPCLLIVLFLALSIINLRAVSTISRSVITPDWLTYLGIGLAVFGATVWRAPRHRGRGKSPRSVALIEAAIAILRQIQPATIRAICYRLFVLGLIPSMTKNETNRVSRLLTEAREQGFIRWGWIVDETRAPERANAFTDPQDYVEVVKRSYRKDHWTDQRERIELGSEKSTIAGILRPSLTPTASRFAYFTVTPRRRPSIRSRRKASATTSGSPRSMWAIGTPRAFT